VSRREAGWGKVNYSRVFHAVIAFILSILKIKYKLYIKKKTSELKEEKTLNISS
jgi:hypothetical protein